MVAISRYTRLLSLFLLPFLAVAAVILYLFPSHTETAFAWTITPSLSSRFLASAYIGGIVFFASAVRAARWQQVSHGLPAITVFAALLGIATLTHFDKFHAGTFIFAIWLVLYLTTPFLAAAAWLQGRRREHRAEPSVDDRSDGYLVPLGFRLVLVVIGLSSFAAGIGLFVFADALGAERLTSAWAWALTPLTASVIGAAMTLPGVVNIWMLFDARWSSYRILFSAEIVALVFIVGALALGHGDLAWEHPSTPVIVAGFVVSLLAFAAFSLFCERQYRRQR